MLQIVKDSDPAELETGNAQVLEEMDQLKKQVSVLSLALEKASEETKSSDELSMIGDTSTDKPRDIPMSPSKTINHSSEEKSSTNVKEQYGQNLGESVEEMTVIQDESRQLRSDCEHLKWELERLQSTYNKLVEAGDNLQDMYDQLLEEKDQLQLSCQEVVFEKDKIAMEKDSLQAQLLKLLHKQELSQEKERTVKPEKDRMDKIVEALSLSENNNKILETKEDLVKKCEEYEDLIQQLRHDYAIVMEEIESLQDNCNQLEMDRDQLAQEYDTSQDEYEQLQQQHEVLQQDYEQLEQDYAQLLGDKEQIKHDMLEVQTTGIKVEQHNPILHEEKKQLLRANSALECEKEQQDLTIVELSNQNALLEEELSNIREQIHQIQQKTMEHNQTETVHCGHQVQSLQIQVSRLQQQLSVSCQPCETRVLLL